MMSDLYRHAPTERFGARAGAYARWRPGYPQSAVDAILAGLPPAERLVVADVGAGTGNLSRQLAERGAWVIAIEPNEAMRASAAPHERVRWADGRAEETGLDDGSVDLVTCAQAFHWFEQEAALAEFARVLRPDGRLALLWNERDRDDPFTNEYSMIIERAAAGDPALQRSSTPDALFASPLFHSEEERRFAYEQYLDRDGLIGRATSSSYVPLAGERRNLLERELELLFDRESAGAESVVLRYVTRVFLATPR